MGLVKTLQLAQRKPIRRYQERELSLLPAQLNRLICSRPERKECLRLSSVVLSVVLRLLRLRRREGLRQQAARLVAVVSMREVC